MPRETSKGWACEVCGEETYYKDTCEGHEMECRRQEAEEHESRLDEIEERLARIEKKIGLPWSK